MDELRSSRSKWGTVKTALKWTSVILLGCAAGMGVASFFSKSFALASV
jgi:hypothetical protein